MYRFVEQPEKLLSHDYSEMNNKLYTFLEKLAAHYFYQNNTYLTWTLDNKSISSSYLQR